MGENPVITFVKKDILLWRTHCPFLTDAQFSEGVVLQLASGREVAFLPPPSEKAYSSPVLEPNVGSSGYTEWTKGIAYGQVVEAEVL
jgi:hypothetical protein